MKFDLNLTILMVILLLNVWSIFVKNTCGETVEGFMARPTFLRKFNEIHQMVTRQSMPIDAAYWDKFGKRVRHAMHGMCMQP